MCIRDSLNVIYLAKHSRFETITEMVIASADDLSFNLVGYYVAKHTLNYIRQLGGYKDGTYAKVQQGKEDNELLHDCIAEVTTEAVLNTESYTAAWDKIMVLVYNAFKVGAEERRTTASLSLIHISEPTRLLSISYAVFCLKKKNPAIFSIPCSCLHLMLRTLLIVLDGRMLHRDSI
eukprot:TRINITY_DN41614_c0_g1_i1.p1 TRINITY_DN41614_c0_g1~~TRINITY_DN41614_c0_g1_i1.p1  ORF type:complete len:177 (-),score=54.27 TRINITY_DN41614_c0_g1_i1:11-541(-)